jgi:ABC-type Zn uptake system ZnuABC Zn-binding protein ZnuA
VKPSAIRCLAAVLPALVFFAGAAGAAADPFAVVATTSDLKSLAEAIGGDKVRVAALVPLGADAEAFEPRPSHLALLRNARLVLRVGLGYDDWLVKLLQQNGEPKLFRGGIGDVDASIGIPLLEVQGRSIEPAARHPHGSANPHYWLDPANAETITAAIAEGLTRVMPDEADAFIANRDRFLVVLKERLATWTEAMAPFRGSAVVGYHNSWPYFARRFHLDIVEVIEPKEGIAPSAARLASIAATIRARQVRVILQEQFVPDDAARLLAGKTNAAVVVLAPSVGAVSQARDYLSLFDYDIDALRRAFSSGS